MSWTPPPRPSWVERLNAFGVAAGGAEKLVSLERDALIEEARRSTGLDDFGDSGWRANYEALLPAIDEESGLHLVGRILTRGDALRCLRNRLQLVDLWRRRPECPRGRAVPAGV